jgi:hypothetical protein
MELPSIGSVTASIGALIHRRPFDASQPARAMLFAQPSICHTKPPFPTHCREPRMKLWIKQVNPPTELRQNIDVATYRYKQTI